VDDDTQPLDLPEGPDLGPLPAPQAQAELPLDASDLTALDEGAPAPSLESVFPERFGPAPRALLQRRLLVGCLGLLIAAGPLLILHALPPPAGWGWLRWGLPPLQVLALLGLALLGASDPLRSRSALLHAQGLELRRGPFRRLIVFESLRHLHLAQAAGGRLISLRLDLEDGSVTLRDLDGLERILEAAAQRRPANTSIEVEERRVDWGEPLPWTLLALAVIVAASLGLALLWPSLN